MLTDSLAGDASLPACLGSTWDPNEILRKHLVAGI